MTQCKSAPQMTFRLFEYDEGGRLHDTGKQFTVSKDETNALAGYNYSDISEAYVHYVMFKKLFGFTAPNGFALRWITPLEVGDIYWRKNHFRIQRVL